MILGIQLDLNDMAIVRRKVFFFNLGCDLCENLIDVHKGHMQEGQCSIPLAQKTFVVNKSFWVQRLKQ